MLLKSKTSPKLIGLLLLLLMFFTLGCFELNMQTKIFPDGSGRRILSVIVDKDVAKELNLSAEKLDLPKGVYLKTKNKGSKTYYQTVIDFEDVATLNKLLARLSKNKGQLTSPSKVRVTKKDFWVVAYYTYEERFSEAKTSELAEPFKNDNLNPKTLIKGLSLTYELSLPGKIDRAKSNAQAYSSASTAIWNLPLTGSSVIKAQATFIRFWIIVALGIIAFAVFLFIVAVVGSYIYKKAKG